MVLWVLIRSASLLMSTHNIRFNGEIKYLPDAYFYLDLWFLPSVLSVKILLNYKLKKELLTTTKNAETQEVLLTLYFSPILSAIQQRLVTNTISPPKQLQLTLVLPNPIRPAFANSEDQISQVLSHRRNQLIWICTLCCSVCGFVSTTWIS